MDDITAIRNELRADVAKHLGKESYEALDINKKAQVNSAIEKKLVAHLNKHSENQANKTIEDKWQEAKEGIDGNAFLKPVEREYLLKEAEVMKATISRILASNDITSESQWNKAMPLAVKASAMGQALKAELKAKHGMLWLSQARQ